MKSALQKILPPIVVPLANTGAFRSAMRGPAAKRFKHQLWHRVLQPYTARRGRPTIVDSSHGRFASSGFMVGFVQRHLWMFDVWEPNLTWWISRQLRPGDVFVDVGANIGYFSVIASGIVGPTGGVIAIEASPSTFETLQRNIELNELTNVRPLNFAAGKHEAIVPLFVLPSEDVTATLTPNAAARRVRVPAAPLSTILTAWDRSRVRVIKIHVHGAEKEVLEGLQPVLGELNDDVEFVVEVSPGSFGGVSELLREFGFHAYELPNPPTPIELSDEAGRLPRVWNEEFLQNRGFAEMVFSRRDAAELSMA